MTTLHPLTHHEILALVEPFTRRGRRVDLDISNRLERRLFFKPIEHAGDTPQLQGLREILRLEHPYPDTYRLNRVVRLPSGLEASLQVEGPHPGTLLDQIESVPPQSHFRYGTGFIIAYSYQLQAIKGTRQVRQQLTQGAALVGGLKVTLNMPLVCRIPADIKLVSAPGDPVTLPEDLLSVIGWDWAPLIKSGDIWTSKLRLRGREPKWSRRAEAKMDKTVQHLAQTLAEPPRRFHERFVAARWGVVVRRTIPILTCFAIIAATMLIPADLVEDSPFLRMLLMNAPLLVIGLSFGLQEQSRIEIPPLPWPSKALNWRPSQTQSAEVQQTLKPQPLSGAAQVDTNTAW